MHKRLWFPSSWGETPAIARKNRSSVDAARQKAPSSSGTKSLTSPKPHWCLQVNLVAMLRQEKTPRVGITSLLWWPLTGTSCSQALLPACDAPAVSSLLRPGFCPIGVRVQLLDLAIQRHGSRI